MLLPGAMVTFSVFVVVSQAFFPLAYRRIIFSCLFYFTFFHTFSFFTYYQQYKEMTNAYISPLELILSKILLRAVNSIFLIRDYMTFPVSKENFFYKGKCGLHLLVKEMCHCLCFSFK